MGSPILTLAFLSLSACGPGHETGSADPGVLSDPTWRLHAQIASLVYVGWQQATAGAVHVEYSFDPDEWLSSPTFEAQAGAQEQLLVGIPYQTEATWRVVTDGETLDGGALQTGRVPTGLPTATVEVSDPEAWWSDGRFLLTSINQVQGGWTGGNYWTLILDRRGRPVWAQLAPHGDWTLFAQVSADGGSILWDQATAWSRWDQGAASTVHRTWLDEEIEVIPTPGLHHAFVELPDGTLVWGSKAHAERTEALVERGPDAEKDRVIWTCAQDWPGVGNCESNGLFWVEATDSFLYSFYTNNSVVEVDRASGASRWWAGQVADGYSFDPPESQFSWQHGISLTAAGTLLVSTTNDGTTGVKEYEIDHDARALHEVWAFDSGVQANTNGDAWRLPNGNTLHLLGSAGWLVEITPDGQAVWSADFHGERLLGRGEYIPDLYALVKPR